MCWCSFNVLVNPQRKLFVSSQDDSQIFRSYNGLWPMVSKGQYFSLTIYTNSYWDRKLDDRKITRGGVSFLGITEQFS